MIKSHNLPRYGLQRLQKNGLHVRIGSEKCLMLD